MYTSRDSEWAKSNRKFKEIFKISNEDLKNLQENEMKNKVQE